jgi:hypothetical protein
MRKRAVRDPLRRSGEGHSSGIHRNAVRQTNVPVPFSFVDFEADARIGWWMVYRGIEYEKIRPQLGDRKRHAIKYQSHSDAGGMSAVTRP